MDTKQYCIRELWLCFPEVVCKAPGEDCMCSKRQAACDTVPGAMCNLQTDICECEQGFFLDTSATPPVCRRTPGKLFEFYQHLVRLLKEGIGYPSPVTRLLDSFIA